MTAATILIAGGDAACRKRLADYLSRRGHLILEADSDLRALEIFKSRPALALVLDTALPGRDAFLLLEDLLARDPHLVICVTTATATVATAVAALDKGACGYFVDPFPLEHLGRRLEDALERRRLLEQSREQEAQYSTIFNVLQVGLVIATLDGGIVEANAAAAAIFGYDRQQFGGLAFADFLAPESAEKMLRICAEVAAGRVAEDFLRGVGRKGGLVEFAVLAAPLVVQGRKHALVMFDDVTEKRRLEAQLRYAQKMEAIGQLAGGVAHDFNNILTAIMGYGNLLAMRLDPENELRDDVDQILVASRRAADLTRNLLAFSRKEPSRLRPLSLADSVNNVLKMLRRILGEGIEIRSELAAEECLVMADGGQIDQILINLATNARDAMPGGGVLSIRTRPVFIDLEFVRCHGFGVPGAYMELDVADAGDGMDDVIRQRAFDPFYTTKEVGKGTGLGLSMVYGIVKQHSGMVVLDSTPGQGTTVRIYFPVSEQEAPGDAAPPPGGHETILVAEDDPTVRNLLQTVLERHGYSVIQAKDGQEAVDLFARNRDRVALAIVDVVMPKKSGMETLAEIRRRGGGCPVILTSGYGADVLHNQGVAAAGVAILPKPISPAELLVIVRRTLAG